MTFTGRGIYRIAHAHVPVLIALDRGRNDDGTHTEVWNQKDDWLDHWWMVEDVPGEADTYRIRNLRSGTYMDLFEGNASNNTPIVGWQMMDPGKNQKWIIKQETSGTGFWKIQNLAAKTFVDLKDGASKDGEQSIVGWAGNWYDGTSSSGHQQWTFEPRSLTGTKVHTALQNNPHLKQDFKSYIADGLYLILPHTWLTYIWDESKLKNYDWRSQIFDSNDSAFVYKAQAAKWGTENLKVDGFAILCGIMFGTVTNSQGEVQDHAYNWMIDPNDHTQIIFFNPQDNTFTDNPGKASFGVF